MKNTSKLQMPEKHRKIDRLDGDVSILLKSQVVISSLADALREVIQNSKCHLETD